ncbi:hypothetical protein CV770_36360 [Bradyrhizobium sp. AC87j1]|uniref:hypothetical protein n=1 Tax=Bradyrhizobium sp. AC87j1 TaxID=2055894 RepID=UPI000D490BE8|nr:hypothetical protein [Bradyrhizobium sp. AC87j1]PPQ14554.1 hypothetical protein CV770_36360 [Bradyrhizobium sp. AC87j1]
MRAFCGLFVLGIMSLATPTYADYKCGDAPYAFAEEDLVDVWIGPVPRGARIRYAEDEIFRQFERHVGPEIPNELPEKYRREVQHVELSNAQISTSVNEASEWLKRYGVALEEGPAKVFRSYIDRGHYIFSTLIEHPPVPNARDFVACSIILQRGIIVMNDDQETLYLRSYFHSTDGKGAAVNFAPNGGLQMTFPSKVAWFPLELTKFITEPAAFVVLDVATPKPVKLRAPTPFRLVGGHKKITFGGLDFYVTRMEAVLERGKEAPDFSVELR